MQCLDPPQLFDFIFSPNKKRCLRGLLKANVLVVYFTCTLNITHPHQARNLLAKCCTITKKPDVAKH